MGDMLSDILKNPSLEVQHIAVEQDGSSIKHIKNPSLEVQLAAIKRCGHAIKYIKNPSPEVQLTAVKKTEPISKISRTHL